MTKRILFLLACLLTSVGLFADNSQTLTINGEVVEKTVVKMTFDGDQVVLHFPDQTTETVAMSAVVLSFEWTSDTGVYSLKHDAGDELNIEGLAPGTVVTLYDAAGHRLMTTTAAEASAQLSAKGLKTGVYLLKAGHHVVKFQKR